MIVSRQAGANEYEAGPDTCIRVCGSVDPRQNRTRSAAFVLYRSTPGDDVIAKARLAVKRELRAAGYRGGRRQMEEEIDKDPRCSREPRTYLAEVEFFFKIRYGADDNTSQAEDGEAGEPSQRSHYLAYIRHMPVKREVFETRDGDGGVLDAIIGEEEAAFAHATLFRLTKIVGVGAHEVVACEDITELAGLIKGGDKDSEIYVVDKAGALWLNLGGEEDDAHQDRAADSGSESESES